MVEDSTPFLRDSFSDPAVAEAEILTLRDRVAAERATNPEGSAPLGRALGRLGDALRVAGNVDESMAVLDEAVELVEQYGDAALVASNRIRLATAAFYAGAYSDAERELRSVIASCSDMKYLGYAWQHLGKCLAEQHEWDVAERCFETALSIRSTHDPPLTGSSRQALVELRERRERGR